jgi:hypothetical protein
MRWLAKMAAMMRMIVSKILGTLNGYTMPFNFERVACFYFFAIAAAQRSIKFLRYAAPFETSESLVTKQNPARRTSGAQVILAG